MSGDARVIVRPAITPASTTNVIATARVIAASDALALLHAELGERLQDLVVERTVGDDDPAVLGEFPALGEVERLAGHIGDRASSLLDDQRTGAVVPDLLSVPRAGGKPQIGLRVSARDDVRRFVGREVEPG